MTLSFNLISAAKLSELKLEAYRAADQCVARNSKKTVNIGAAALSNSGNIYIGSYILGRTASTTIHAEQAAIISSILNDDDIIVGLAIYSKRSVNNPPLSPCGTCLQFLAEYAENLEILVFTSTISSFPEWSQMTLRELLPRPWCGWAPDR